MSKVYLLGAGPGDPGLLTLRAKEILEKADVVVYDALANASFLDFARPDAERIYVGKIADQHAMSQENINRLLVEKAKEGKDVARLKGGDPYIFGRGGEEAQELLAAGVEFEEVPGITSTIAAPAYAGIPLTHRDFSSSVTIVTGHENPDKKESSLDWPSLARSASTLVFVMGMKNLPLISKHLIDAGMKPDTPAALVYRGTTPFQRTLVSTIGELPERAVQEHFTNPSVIVVGGVCRLHDSLDWFGKKPLLGRRVVVTRARAQASGLAALLAEQGAYVLQCPTIRIQPLADQSALDSRIGSLDSYAWVIFTSVNGVKVFWERLRHAGRDARAIGRTRVAAIGPATAGELRKHGIFPDFVPPKYIAESVIEGLTAQGGLKGTKILIPRAAKAREVLPDALRAQGAEVDVVPVYETVPECSDKEAFLAALRAGELDCITFGSSSTVDNLLSIVTAEELKEHPEVKLACIGPVTARTLEGHGLKCAVMPDEYTIPALVQALIDTYRS